MTSDKTEKFTIIIVDSDDESNGQLSEYFEMHNFSVAVIKFGDDLYSYLAEYSVDMVLLEAKLNHEDGFEICKRIRQFSTVPIIFFSHFAESADKILALELGADDFLQKPFERRELLARIKAILRRTKQYREQEMYSSNASLSFENWVLNCVSRHLVNPDKQTVELSGAEYRLLHYFLTHPQQVISRERLIETIQGRSEIHERNPFDRSIDVQVSRVRAKIQDNMRSTKLIKTVRGDGYVFTGNVQSVLL